MSKKLLAAIAKREDAKRPKPVVAVKKKTLAALAFQPPLK